jgi:TATA-binding protein-associated factor
MLFIQQVMPFLLRRTKDEVLSDLPEKIIQDRYCDLSPVQLKLYEQFSGSLVRQEISSMVKLDDSAQPEGNSASPKASTHVFQVMCFFCWQCVVPPLLCNVIVLSKLSCATFFNLSGTSILVKTL